MIERLLFAVFPKTMFRIEREASWCGWREGRRTAHYIREEPTR